MTGIEVEAGALRDAGYSCLPSFDMPLHTGGLCCFHDMNARILYGGEERR